jgi:hypothetical protein
VRGAFADAVQRVEKAARDIWANTHGCRRCAALWNEQGVAMNEYGEDFAGADGCTPIHEECAECKGKGVIL